MLMNDNPIVIAVAAAAAAVAAWFGNGSRLKRRTNVVSSVEQLVSDAVSRNYHALVTEVATLRAEVKALQADVQDRDARIDELEHDKQVYADRIDELTREVEELRSELANYRPTRRRKPAASEGE